MPDYDFTKYLRREINGRSPELDPRTQENSSTYIPKWDTELYGPKPNYESAPKVSIPEATKIASEKAKDHAVTRLVEKSFKELGSRPGKKYIAKGLLRGDELIEKDLWK